MNWCPALGTVLANEEVIDGKSERGGYPVERRPLRQWMMRITAYADRLEKDLETLDWSEGVKALQRNWIGRSTGAEVDFRLQDAPTVEQRSAGFPAKPDEHTLRVYTTRPDTLFGATYMVIAPEHPYVEKLTTQRQQSRAVDQYVQQAALKSDLDRTELAKEKTGVFTGSYAINPVNGEPVPIWIADYVLISYGTGAIMAVPAHDERDFEFAQGVRHPHKAGRPTRPRQCLSRKKREKILAGEQVFPEHGTAINSGEFDGLPTAEFKTKITEWLSRKRPRQTSCQLQAPRLALQPPALLGRAVSDSARNRPRREQDRRSPRRAGGSVAGRPAASGRFQTARTARAAARQGT